MKSSSLIGRILSIGVLILLPYIVFSSPVIQGPAVPAMYWRSPNGASIFYTGGNIGIGLNSPNYLLDVNGIVSMSGFRMQIGVTSGYVLTTNASGIGSWMNPNTLISESDPQVGAMTTNYFPRWNGSALINSSLVESGTYIGLGTTNPLHKFEVTGGYIADKTGRIARNLLDSTAWYMLTGTVSSGTVSSFVHVGSVSENLRTWGVDPYGKLGILWTSYNDGASDADGGWSYANIPIDNEKGYRYTVWAKRVGSTAGSIYIGSDPANTNNLDGTQNVNPYFITASAGGLVNDRWYLFVGYVRGLSDTGTVSYGGVYDGVTGQKVFNTVDYRNRGATNFQTHRAFSYYDTNTGSYTYFYGPRFEEIDGNEPSVEALLGIGVHATQAKNAYFGGNVSIGKSTPSYTLDVAGTGAFYGLRISSGAGNNYILTSDATGNARWVATGTLLAAESDPQVGANTTDFLSKWDGSALVASSVYNSSTGVGIGTTALTNALTVAGTGTFYGLRISSGAGNNYILTSDASGNARWVSTGTLVSIPSENDPQVGTISSNYIPKWSGSALEGGLIYDSGTGIAIGTSVPLNRFHVTGGGILNNDDLNVNGDNFIVDTSTKSTALYGFGVRRSGTTVAGITIGGGAFFTGSVGIGTSSPTYKLEVVGTGSFLGFRLPSGASNNYILASDASGNARWVTTGSLISGVAESDPIWTAQKVNYATSTGVGASGVWPINITGTATTANYAATANFATMASGIAWTGVIGRPTNVSTFTNDAGYLTSESDPQVGSNTTNYVPYWNGSSLVSGLLVNTSTGIGIGTTTPNATFDVTGSGRFSGDLTVIGKLVVDNLVNRTVSNITISGSLLPDTAAPMSYRNIGNDTTGSWNNLYLSGQIKIKGGSPGVGRVLVSDAEGLASWAATGSLVTIPSEVDPEVGTITTNYIPYWNGTSLVTGYAFNSSTGIGLGTTALTATLDVIGSGRFTNNLTVGGNITTNGNLTSLGTGTFAGLRISSGAASNYILASDASGNARWVTTGSLIGGVSETDPIWTAEKTNYATSTGVGASGTWGINISGNAATATNAVNATNANYALLSSGVAWTGVIGRPTNVSSFANDAGYLTGSSVPTYEVDPQVGTITTNYIPYWNGTSLVTGYVFNSSTGIGLGTTALSATLDVTGSGRFTNNLTVGGNLNTSGNITTNGNLTSLGTGTFAGLRISSGAASNYILASDASGNARWIATGSLIAVPAESDPIWNAQKVNYATSTGVGASGTWGINISGNAATATNANYALLSSGVAWTGVINRPIALSEFINDVGYFSGAESDPQVGTITTNYIPYWNGTSLVTGYAFNSSTGIGLGTTALSATLDVIGSGRFTNNLTSLGTGTFAGLRISSGAASNYILASDASGNARWIATGSLIAAESDPQVGTITTNYIPYWNGTSLVTGYAFNSSTGIGLGTTALSATLDVIGSGRFTNNLTSLGTGTFAGLRISSGAASNYILASDASGNARWIATGSLITVPAESDPIWNAQKVNYATSTGVGASGTWGINISGNAATATNATNATNANYALLSSGVAWTGVIGRPTNVSSFANDAGYLTSYTETDPIWTAEKTNYATSTGVGASGTWGINISGNAATATNAVNATNANYALLSSGVAWTGVIGRPTTLGSFTNDIGYITGSSVPTYEVDPQVGANTTNYLSKWNGSALVGSQVFDNGTNVGIGTATPGAKLDIKGAPVDSLVLDADSGFQGRWVRFPGRVTAGSAGAGYPSIGYNFYPTSTGTYVKIANDTAYGIHLGNSNRITFSYAPIGTGTIAWNDAMVINNVGNVGIGTATPGAKLDVNGSINTNGIVTATGFKGGRVSNEVNGLRIAQPGGAAYATSTSVINGAIKIKLPVASFKSNTMIRMTVKIYEYAGSSQGTSRTLELGGYNYGDAAANWYNTFATQETMGGGEVNVRFGNDGTSQCIWIGETTSTWSYPQVFVTDFQGGYSNYTDAMWGTGWNISFATTLDTITQGPYTIGKNLSSQNFNSYSPTLAGVGASGTWGISITGNAATASAVPWSGVTGKPTTLAGYGITDAVNTTGDQTIGGNKTFTGDVIVQGKVVTDTLVNRTVQNLTISGSLYPYSTSSSKDLGATGNRWNNGFFGGNIAAGGWVGAGCEGECEGGGGYSLMYPNGTIVATTSVTAPSFIGNATTATTASAVPWSGVTSKPTTLAGYGITDFISSNASNPVAADAVTTNGNYYVNANIGLFGQTDGALYSQAYGPSWVGQIYQDYRTGQIALRGKNNGVWQAWRTNLDSGNYTSYAPSLTGGGASGTWGINVTGNAATASNATQLGNITATNYIALRTYTTSGALDTITDQALRLVSYPGHSRTILTLNAGGSPGTIQQEFHYNPAVNGWRIRGHQDSTTWNPWSFVVMSANNQGNISGTIFHTANDGSGSSLDADLLDGQQGSYYAPINSPNLTGTPTAPTAASGTNSTQIATTAFVNTEISKYTPYQSARDFATGTLIATDIDYSLTEGEPWLLEIEGNSYGSAIPFDIKYQGYIYSDTVINHGGISNGTYLTGMVLFNYNGKLHFWFPRQGYWQGFTVAVNSSYAGFKKNRLVSITSQDKPGGITKEVSLSPNIRQSLHSSNFNTYTPTLAGVGATGTWPIGITGNAATATIANTFSTNRTNYKNITDGSVAGQLMWKNYGNNHTIFDASASTSPDGTAVNSSNSANPWMPSYPTLMGWNGSSTYGVRVDSARVADSATNATRARFIDAPDGDRNAGTKLPNANTRSVQFDFVSANTANGGGNYAGLMTYSPWDGTTASTGDASYQLAFNSTAANGGGIPYLSLRKGIDSTWNSWYTLLHSGNFNSYSPTLAGVGASGTWPIGITGNAATVSTVGANTLNYLSKWNGSALVTSGIFDNGTNVGIGTNTPGAKLDVNGAIYGTSVGTRNPNNSGAISFLDWLDDVSRIRIGGNGTGASNGFDIQFSGNTSVLRILGNGNVGIGTTTPGQKLEVAGNILATSYLTASDKNLKQDIRTLTGALDRILALRGYSFTWKSDGRRDVGIIAQDVERQFPELVHTNLQGIKSVEYANLIAPVIEAIHEQQSIINQQKVQIDELNSRLKKMESLIESIDSSR